MKTATRHRAREAALQMLYAWEVGRAEAADAIATHGRMADLGEPLPDEARAFAESLARGTIGAVGDLDRLIERHAEHWRLTRMAAIDRLILRLAAFELTQGDVPAPVVIDEAIELARSFSEAEAAGFVNGVLDAIHRSRAGADGPPDR